MTNINLLQTLKPNNVGEDYIVGDIHGHFDKLDAKLEEICFNYEKDRLIVVGDLIDRGPRSNEFLEYLNKDWFYTVRGNHEDFLVNCVGYILNRIPMEQHVFNITYNTWMGNGGRWFEQLLETTPEDEKVDLLIALYDTVAELPFFMEIPVGDKKVGVVHAELREVDSWNDIHAIAKGGQPPAHTDIDTLLRDALWSRSRFEKCASTAAFVPDHLFVEEEIKDVDAIFCGHTPVIQYTSEVPLTIGNHHYIDTCVYSSMYEDFQIIKLSEFLN